MSFVLSANRLIDGSVVYLAEDDNWTDRIADAKRLNTPDEQDRAKTVGVDAENACQVVGADLIPLSCDEPTITPARLRELIRAVGPTVRPDLARQSS